MLGFTAGEGNIRNIGFLLVLLAFGGCALTPDEGLLASSELVQQMSREGGERVGQWRDYHRNILEDYRRAFGDEPWDIVAVGVMTDSDNTKQKTRCLYGDITFLKGQ